MTRDPFRRPPMVDIPIAQGESIFWRFSNAMDRLVEAVETYGPAKPYFLDLLSRKMDEASTCPRCGCPPERFCSCTPDACGCTPPTPPNPETPMPTPARHYVPVNDTDDDEVKWVKQAQNRALLAERTGTSVEAALARQSADDIAAAYEHRQQAARTQPPEPPVGTVLETSDDFVGCYRIERTDDGWRQQYYDGESPDGSRTSPTFGGRGISWPAAWSAWGPPNGAEPFWEVPADAPLLPAPPAEPGDDNPVGPDASGGWLDPPLPAEPWVDSGDEQGIPWRETTAWQVPETTGPAPEDDMGRDAFRGTFDPPPPAAPYVPPRETTDPKIRTKGRVDWVRWLGPGHPGGTRDQRPPQAVNASAQLSGGTMPNIEEAREGIMTAQRNAQQGLAELEQAHSSLEDAQNGLRQGTEGTNQAEADQAHAQLADAMNKIDEARQQVAQALAEFEGVANRL